MGKAFNTPGSHLLLRIIELGGHRVIGSLRKTKCGKCLFDIVSKQLSSEGIWLITTKRDSTVDWPQGGCPKKAVF